MFHFSAANIVFGLLFSSVGFVGFVYGKRMSRWKLMFIGLLLMAYPYFVEDTLTLFGLGVTGIAAIFLFRS